MITLTGRELTAPLETFLLYPNYRGMMFSDQSQVARVAIDVTPPADTTMAQLHVVLEVIDPGAKVLSTYRLSPPVDGSTVATVDMGSLAPGRYRLQGYLEGPGNKRIFTQSSYTIAKVSSEMRPSMKAWIDPDNIIHMGGRPRFVIGLYDTSGYALRPDYYGPRLTAIAKAPINLMINYFLANGRADVIYPYTEAMEPFGIFYLATVSAFFPEMRAYPSWAQAEKVGPDRVIAQYSKGLAGDSRVVGYYTCDECASQWQPRTFHQYGLIKQYDPASITFAVENYPNEFQFWRDSVDVLGVDPYVLGSRYDELVNVTRGISALEPVLLAQDSPVLSANSASGIVITKEKDLKDAGRYLISYNHSVEARFTLRRPAHAVSVDGENRSIASDQGGSRFKDTYAPFQAHVYKID